MWQDRIRRGRRCAVACGLPYLAWLIIQTEELENTPKR